MVGSVSAAASPTPSPVNTAGPTSSGTRSSSSSVCSGSCGSKLPGAGAGAGSSVGTGRALAAGALGAAGALEAAGAGLTGACATTRPPGRARPAVVELGAGAGLAGPAPGLAAGLPDGAGGAGGAGGADGGTKPGMALGSPRPSTGWKVSCAVWPIRRSASAASVTPGSSTMMRRSPERASVGSETPRASTRRRRTSTVRSVPSASATLPLVSWVSRVIEAPPRRSRPRRGSLVKEK